jgi:S-DNA-T family DNA segregation ATPase FtsK/SpoIIIE
VRIRHRLNGAERTVEIDSRLDGFTVADLAAALRGELEESGGRSRHGLCIDGCWHSPETLLTSVPIWEGALLEVAPGCEQPSSQSPSEQDSRPGRRVTPVVTAGLRAGTRLVPPASDDWVIGRSQDCDLVLHDPTVSRRHARVTASGTSRRPTIGDLGSRNGTVLAGRAVVAPTRVPVRATVRLGATCLQWRTPVDDAPAAVRAGLGATAGRIPFNRPPRRWPPTTPAPLRVPAAPPARPESEPLSWAGIVLPAAAGLALAVVWSPFMAVFAALGPLITVGTWLERRRRVARSHQRACADVAKRVESFVRMLPAGRAAERRRRIALVPDLAELVRRAETPSQRCWERRRGDPDAMRLGVGTAAVPYTPPLEVDGGEVAAPDALETLQEIEPLADVPVAVSLLPGEVVGVFGPPSTARAVARGLILQAAVLHGPADLAIAGLAPGLAGEWSWMGWLPHTSDTGGEPGALVATESGTAAAAAEAAAATTSHRPLLALIDGVETLTGRSAPGRMLLGLEQCAGIVITSDVCDLPSSCTTIVDIDHDAGRLRLVDPRSSAVMGPLLAWGVTVATATGAAARLARLDDPELRAATANLPDSMSLQDLLGGEPTPQTVESRWAATRGTDDLQVPIGAAADGPLVLDLVADGPHLLIGGTTGSGKSELLRSLVAGLALSADPDHLAFVLIDYKGGAAFDRCAEMPHVAGMVTDLDDRLAERALLCLEAELRHREERLRAVGAEDLAAFRARAGHRGGHPLPRLVVVVDEFATLAAELPEFLRSLVGIAQRGRSLGVHMVLATQRPAGVVTDDIRANTSCRIALRMTDRHDSNDVIDSPDAARIPRQRPGRAMARFGPGELVAFQSALVTGSTPRGSTGLRVGPVGLRPLQTSGHQHSDIDSVVEAVRAAHQNLGAAEPRSPWPAPLPAKVAATRLAETAGPDRPAAWLVDDPVHQRQFPGGWHPADGHLAVIGGPGSGTTTTLAAVTLDLCRTHTPDQLHVYGIDLDSGTLSALGNLPHVGAVVAPTEGDRRTRLLRLLDDEVAARRAGGRSEIPAEVVLLVDDLAGLVRAHDPVREPEPHDRFARIWGDGPAVGVRVAVSIGRAADLPPDLAASAGVVLVHATSDVGDGLRFGLKQPTAHLVPGRAVRVGDGLEVHVARPANGDLALAATALAAESPPTMREPVRVGSLPQHIGLEGLPASAHVEDRCIHIRFAISDLDLEPAGLTLHDGEHALVLGPPRTGRTCALAAIGAAARTAGAHVVVVADRPGELSTLLGLEAVPPDSLGEAAGTDTRRLLLVDDADRIDDPAGRLAEIAASTTGRSHLVASTTADRLRSSYGSWLHEMRSCRTGVLFRPGPLDADLLGATVPARLALAPVSGRCLVIADGVAEVMQVALAAPDA